MNQTYTLSLSSLFLKGKQAFFALNLSIYKQRLWLTHKKPVQHGVTLAKRFFDAFMQFLWYSLHKADNIDLVVQSADHGYHVQ